MTIEDMRTLAQAADLRIARTEGRKIGIIVYGEGSEGPVYRLPETTSAAALTAADAELVSSLSAMGAVVE